MGRAQGRLSQGIVLLGSEGLNRFIDNDPRAIDLLRDASLHGHKYAIDSVVAATALDHAGPRIVVTSDVDDMNKLCGDRVRAVGV